MTATDTVITYVLGPRCIWFVGVLWKNQLQVKCEVYPDLKVD